MGVVRYIIGLWILFPKYSSFQLRRNFENRLGFDKVIAISWVVHFWDTPLISAILVLCHITQTGKYSLTIDSATNFPFRTITQGGKGTEVPRSLNSINCLQILTTQAIKT